MKKLTLTSVILVATTLFLTSCNSTPTGETANGETATENSSEQPFNLFQSIAQIRADVNPSKAFLDFKAEYLKPDKPLTLTFVVHFINNKESFINLRLAELKGDQLAIANGSGSTVENTIVKASLPCTPEELKKIPGQFKAGLNFISKIDNVAILPATKEFKTKLVTFNKQFGYEVLSEFSLLENQIGYLLTGDYHYADYGGLYSEASFEKSIFSDDTEIKKLKFFLEELEHGTLQPILKAYQNKQLALIDFQEANKKNAVDPQTIVTVTGAVSQSDFQYPLMDKNDHQYAELNLILSNNCKIIDIKPYNKNFIALVQASNITGDGITAIKKKLEFYSKNKPVNDPNAEYEKDGSWEKNLEQ